MDYLIGIEQGSLRSRSFIQLVNNKKLTIKGTRGNDRSYCFSMSLFHLSCYTLESKCCVDNADVRRLPVCAWDRVEFQLVAGGNDVIV